MLDDPGTVDEQEHVGEANAKTSRPALTKVIDVEDLDYPSRKLREPHLDFL